MSTISVIQYCVVYLNVWVRYPCKRNSGQIRSVNAAGVCSFRDWGASPSIRSGMSTVHACPSTKPNPLFEQENALRRIDQQLEDFRANITSPMQDVPCRVRQKLEHQNTVITSLEEDNYILRRMVMDLQAKLLTNGTVQSPLSSVADNSPLDEYSYL